MQNYRDACGTHAINVSEADHMPFCRAAPTDSAPVRSEYDATKPKNNKQASPTYAACPVIQHGRATTTAVQAKMYNKLLAFTLPTAYSPLIFSSSTSKIRVDLQQQQADKSVRTRVQ